MNLNQFAMSVVKGMVDLLNGGGRSISAMVDVTSALGVDGGVGLIPGQPVKLVPSNIRGVPKVIECATDADDIYGFVVYNPKDSKYLCGDRLEILPMKGGIMYMEANAAIAQGAEVAVLIAGVKVITATATDRIIGRAFDGASAAGKIIRVTVDLPGAIKA